MAVLTIEKLLGGWIPQNASASPTEGRPDQYTRSSGPIGFYRDNFIGHIAPGELFTALTDADTRVNEIAVAMDISSGGESFAVLANGRVVQFGSNDVVNGTNVIAHSGHASIVGEDVLAYNSGATTEFLLYSFRDGTDWDVG